MEDDADIRETMQLVLELEGYAVATAANGREALDLLACGNRPALILLDLMMPVMGGWEFAGILEKDPCLAEIPVVLVTAFADRADSPRVQAVLKKPVATEELLRLVARWAGDPDAAS